jgi:rubrerythrin
MLVFSKKTTDYLELINLLNQVWKLENSFIDNYPRLARSIRDQYTIALLSLLATASAKHADILVRAFAILEEKPNSDCKIGEETPNLIEFLIRQMEKERLAMKLNQQISGLVEDETLKIEFSRMADEEYTHIKMVKTIIYNLNCGVDKNELDLSLAPAIG